MRKAFVIVPSHTVVDPSGDTDIGTIVQTIIMSTVIIKTREGLGEGVIIAGKIITSLFLVQNEIMVSIILPQHRYAQAVVSRKDELNHIAELTRVSLHTRETDRCASPSGGRVHTGPVGGVGAPLLTADARSGTPAVVVAGMSYVVTVPERREEDSWKFHPRLPVGLTGGGVWNINGSFVGLSLATKISHTPRDRGMLLVLPADQVMNFAETS